MRQVGSVYAIGESELWLDINIDIVWISWLIGYGLGCNFQLGKVTLGQD